MYYLWLFVMFVFINKLLEYCTKSHWPTLSTFQPIIVTEIRWLIRTVCITIIDLQFPS